EGRRYDDRRARPAVHGQPHRSAQGTSRAAGGRGPAGGARAPRRARYRPPPGRRPGGSRARGEPLGRVRARGGGAPPAGPGGFPLDRLLPLYREYDAFVLPTLPGEGVPRVLLEAMAAGVPVVATNVAGIPSLVVHERNGLLVDEPSADAVAGAVWRLASDGAL